MNKLALVGLLLAAALFVGAAPKPSKEREHVMGFQLVGYGITPVATAALVKSVEVTVPEGEYWKILSLGGRMSTSATAGNRYGEVVIMTGISYVRRITWPTAIPASQAQFLDTVHGAASANVTITAAIRAQTTPFDPMIILPGYSFYLQDTAAVDAAADLFSLTAQYEIWRYVSGDVQDVRVQGVVETEART